MGTSVYVAGVGSTKVRRIARPHPAKPCRGGRARGACGFQYPSARIGCVFVGNFVGGIMTGQELLGPIVAADLGLSNVAAVKIEAACASSSAAARIGHDLIRAGAEDAVLVIGVERLTGAPRDALTDRNDGGYRPGHRRRMPDLRFRFLGDGDGASHASLRHHARAGRRGDGEKPEIRREQSAGAVSEAGLA